MIFSSALTSLQPDSALSYAIAGLFAYLVVRALGELTLHRPSSGSFVSYSREFLGEAGAYVAGWMYVLNWSTTGMADSTAVALYVHYWERFQGVPQWTLALFALAVVLSVNLVSVRLFGEIEFWFALVKVAAILGFLAVGVWLLGSGHPVAGSRPGLALIKDNGGIFPLGVLPVFAVFQSVVFAYAGVELVGTTAGETPDPAAVVPRAVRSVSWRIALFYVGYALLLLPFTAGPVGRAFSESGSSIHCFKFSGVLLNAPDPSVSSGVWMPGSIRMM